MINFLRFFLSKLFLKQLLWAGLLIVLFVGLSFYGLNKLTQQEGISDMIVKKKMFGFNPESKKV